MKLLVLGAQGQLGQELAALCGVRNVAAKSMTRLECDISNPGQIRAAIEGANPSVIVNAAAYTKVDQAEKEAGAAQLANCDGPAMLAQASADLGVPLIHVSTDYVFDGSKPSAYVETDPVMPLGIYGLSKEAGERAIRSVQHRHVIVRTAWVYGIYGRNFLKTMLDLAATRDGWGVVSDQVGNPTATADLAEALLTAAEKTSRSDACSQSHRCRSSYSSPCRTAAPHTPPGTSSSALSLDVPREDRQVGFPNGKSPITIPPRKLAEHRKSLLRPFRRPSFDLLKRLADG